jgi:F-type H+-transporting ATPase subunit a
MDPEHAYLRVVPTADLNTTFGLSIAVFLLIQVFGISHKGVGGFALAAGHIVAGTIWAIFHILIIVLQAFIFMMLALVYIGQAHETH